MSTPAYDLWNPPPAAPAPHHAPKARRVPGARILADSLPLREAYTTTGAWVRQVLAEYSAAHDCERRARCYAGKPTTDERERLAQLELSDHHLRRQEIVVMALTSALTERTR